MSQMICVDRVKSFVNRTCVNYGNKSELWFDIDFNSEAFRQYPMNTN